MLKKEIREMKKQFQDQESELKQLQNEVETLQIKKNQFLTRLNRKERECQKLQEDIKNATCTTNDQEN